MATSEFYGVPDRIVRLARDTQQEAQEAGMKLSDAQAIQAAATVVAAWEGRAAA
ncbi:hypothetical protein [Dietzia kunjamensis]|uniref:hypothetical protein n=1 Tax=Dietzia kunjamensis TaxID=322509 RepID=UPI003890AC28